MPSAFLNVEMEEKLVYIAIRFEGEGGTHGDTFFSIEPGGSYAGMSYDELVEHGSGELVLTPSMLAELAEDEG